MGMIDRPLALRLEDQIDRVAGVDHPAVLAFFLF
jgi:hypothetical protein